MNDLHLDFRRAELDQRLSQRFLRALHIGLDDEGQRLRLAFAHVVEDVVELGCLAPVERDLAVLALAEGRDLARPALIGQHHELVASLRHLGQALDLDRNRRTGFLAGLAVFIGHRPDTAKA